MSADFAPWAFIIDTDSYSGNFERELCAWITGQVGECGVGDKHAEIARKELPNDLVEWFKYHSRYVADDENGCKRPVSIWTTPGFYNDGVGNQWPDDADPEEVRVKYLKTIRNILSHMGNKNNLAEAENTPHHEAYQSVALFLNLQPSTKILGLMKERALSYQKDQFGMGKFNILGFRLIKMELKETVEWEEKT